jgi:hypothetical protein
MIHNPFNTDQVFDNLGLVPDTAQYTPRRRAESSFSGLLSNAFNFFYIDAHPMPHNRFESVGLRVCKFRFPNEHAGDIAFGQIPDLVPLRESGLIHVGVAIMLPVWAVKEAGAR